MRESFHRGQRDCQCFGKRTILYRHHALETNLASRWEGVGFPRPSGKSGGSANSPGSSSATSPEVPLNSNPKVPRKFPATSRKFPALPRKFPRLTRRSAPSSRKPETLSRLPKTSSERSLQPHPPLAGVSLALQARNPQKSLRESLLGYAGSGLPQGPFLKTILTPSRLG